MTRCFLLTQLSSLYSNTEPFPLWKIIFLTSQPSQMLDKHFDGKTRSKVQLTYFLINVVLQTWHFIHKIINPQICRQFFSLTTPATLGKTTLRIRLRLTFFATSAPSGQVDSKVGLAILVICIITLLADLLFIGLIFSEKQLLYQVLTKLM